MSADQERQFVSAERKKIWKMVWIAKPSGVKNRKALGSGERYHALLRQEFKKVRADAPGIPEDHHIFRAVKPVSDTAGPSGLFPTLLFFGAMSRIPVQPKGQHNQAERMKAM